MKSDQQWLGKRPATPKTYIIYCKDKLLSIKYILVIHWFCKLPRSLKLLLSVLTSFMHDNGLSGICTLGKIENLHLW